MGIFAVSFPRSLDLPGPDLFLFPFKSAPILPCAPSFPPYMYRYVVECGTPNSSYSPRPCCLFHKTLSLSFQLDSPHHYTSALTISPYTNSRIRCRSCTWSSSSSMETFIVFRPPSPEFLACRELQEAASWPHPVVEPWILVAGAAVQPQASSPRSPPR